MLPAAEEEKRIGGEEPMGQILVLNENRLEREVTRSILERGLEPSEVTFASEGESALKLMQEEDVDLLTGGAGHADPCNLRGDPQGCGALCLAAGAAGLPAQALSAGLASGGGEGTAAGGFLSGE